jgi:hypothetical protein
MTVGGLATQLLRAGSCVSSIPFKTAPQTGSAETRMKATRAALVVRLDHA